MSSTTPALLVALALGLVSCARGEVLDAPIRSAQAPVVLGCPLGVPHTHIDVVETREGADVLFTTTEPRVEALRARVRQQMEVHGPGQHLGPGHLGRHGLKHDHGLHLWALPPREVRVVDAPRGSVLQIAAVDPARRDALVAQLRARVTTLDSRPCPW